MKPMSLMTIFLVFVIALMISPLAYAASGKIQWEMYLIVVTIISMAGAVWITRRKQYEETVVKVLVTGVYFWVLAFAQLGVLAGVYSFFY